MPVIVYAESWKGLFRKSTFEAVSYANETAKLLGTDVIAISLGDVSNEELSKLDLYVEVEKIKYPAELLLKPLKQSNFKKV